MMTSYGYGGMMNGYWGYGGMMGGYGYGGMFGLAGILFGVVVIVADLMLYNKPVDHAKWFPTF